ncbi:MAG: AarF/ABC1/UbiB kinase family protein, partial [Chitinophagales bacterium]
GNFIISEDNQLMAIDFGCMKSIPDEFYVPYFELVHDEYRNDDALFEKKLYNLEMLIPEDSEETIHYFKTLFRDLLAHFTRPFVMDVFDFSDKEFFNRIAEYGKTLSQDKTLRKMNGSRGSRHFIYMNRTFFGLYNLLHDLKADKIVINNYQSFL